MGAKRRKEPEVLAWWVEPTRGVLEYGDGRKPVEGEVLEVPGRPELCKHGLHASVYALDALQYVHNTTIWRVSVWGDVDHSDEKICGNFRRNIKRVDATKVLSTFAIRCALDVITKWDAPGVVHRYLETGDESIRGQAQDAAKATYAATYAADAAYPAYAATYAATYAAKATYAATYAAKATYAATYAADAAYAATYAADAAYPAYAATCAAKATYAAKATDSYVSAKQKYRNWLNEMLLEEMNNEDEERA